MNEVINEDRALSLELSHKESSGFSEKEWDTGTVAL